MMEPGEFLKLLGWADCGGMLVSRDLAHRFPAERLGGLDPCFISQTYGRWLTLTANRDEKGCFILAYCDNNGSGGWTGRLREPAEIVGAGRFIYHGEYLPFIDYLADKFPDFPGPPPKV